MLSRICEKFVKSYCLYLPTGCFVRRLDSTIHAYYNSSVVSQTTRITILLTVVITERFERFYNKYYVA